MIFVYILLSIYILLIIGVILFLIIKSGYDEENHMYSDYEDKAFQEGLLLTAVFWPIGIVIAVICSPIILLVKILKHIGRLIAKNKKLNTN